MVKMASSCHWTRCYGNIHIRYCSTSLLQYSMERWLSIIQPKRQTGSALKFSSSQSLSSVFAEVSQAAEVREGIQSSDGIPVENQSCGFIQMKMLYLVSTELYNVATATTLCISSGRLTTFRKMASLQTTLWFFRIFFQLLRLWQLSLLRVFFPFRFNISRPSCCTHSFEILQLDIL